MTLISTPVLVIFREWEYVQNEVNSSVIDLTVYSIHGLQYLHFAPSQSLSYHSRVPWTINLFYQLFSTLLVGYKLVSRVSSSPHSVRPNLERSFSLVGFDFRITSWEVTPNVKRTFIVVLSIKMVLLHWLFFLSILYPSPSIFLTDSMYNMEIILRLHLRLRSTVLFGVSKILLVTVLEQKHFILVWLTYKCYLRTFRSYFRPSGHSFSLLLLLIVGSL